MLKSLSSTDTRRHTMLTKLMYKGSMIELMGVFQQGRFIRLWSLDANQLTDDLVRDVTPWARYAPDLYSAGYAGLTLQEYLEQLGLDKP